MYACFVFERIKNSAKEPNISAKEPNISAKEPKDVAMSVACMYVFYSSDAALLAVVSLLCVCVCVCVVCVWVLCTCACVLLERYCATRR